MAIVTCGVHFDDVEAEVDLPAVNDERSALVIESHRPYDAMSHPDAGMSPANGYLSEMSIDCLWPVLMRS